MSGMELRDLEAQLRALRQEEEELDVQLHGIQASDGARSCSTGTVEGGEAADDCARHCKGSSFAPAAGDVRGRKRAVFIRRSAAVGSLVLGVMLAVTLVSQPLEREDALLDTVDGSVPATLHDAGDALSKDDKTALELRLEASQQLDRWHEKWEKDRAAHLLHLIQNRAALQEKRQAERQSEKQSINEHRQQLAERKAQRAALIAADEHKFARGAHELQDAQFRQQDLAQEKSFKTDIANKDAMADVAFAERQHANQVEAQRTQTARQAHDQAEAAARHKYQEAREAMVKGKDALRDALAQRDQQAEALRSNDFVTAAEAQKQMQPIDDKIKRLLRETESAKRAWQDAHTALEHIEDQGSPSSSVLAAASPSSSSSALHTASVASDETKRRAATKDAALQRVAAKASGSAAKVP